MIFHQSFEVFDDELFEGGWLLHEGVRAVP
jgi:hypothetical protein